MASRKWRVEALEPADRKFVDDFLIGHDFHFYDELQAKLAERGVTVGLSALQGYARRLRNRRALERIQDRAMRR